MIQYGVVLFHTTSSAMRAEKLLLRENIALKLMPTPREFSSDCGIALRFEWSQCEQVKLILEAARVEINTIHEL